MNFSEAATTVIRINKLGLSLSDSESYVIFCFTFSALFSENNKSLREKIKQQTDQNLRIIVQYKGATGGKLKGMKPPNPMAMQLWTLN